MSEDFLKNPLSLFDIRGKTAIVTGATGAFGALAAKVLAGAGANVVICANNAAELKKVAAECEQLGAKVESVAKRPSSEANCDAIVEAAVKTLRPRRHPGGRVRPEQGLQDRRPEAGGLPRRDGRQRHAVLADGARRRPADAEAGPGRQGHPDVVGARAARPSGRLHRLLRLEVGGRRHHQGARLRVGRYRHHRQRPRADGLPLAADRLDVRGHRARQDRAQRLSRARAEGPARRAVRSRRAAACSWPRRRRISTPATSSTPTAATRRADLVDEWRQRRASPSSAPA